MYASTRGGARGTLGSLRALRGLGQATGAPLSPSRGSSPVVALVLGLSLGTQQVRGGGSTGTCKDGEMFAIRIREYGGPEVNKKETTPRPVPGPGEVLVRVRASGVNPADTYLREGKNGYSVPAFPYTPGKDGSGEVWALGEGVEGAPGVGERVFFSFSTSGSAAEYALAPAKYVGRLPQGVSYEAGASVVVPYGTAWRAMFQKGGVRPGQSMLVHGASGGVGLAAVQLGAALGMSVIGTASTDAGLDLVRANGAQHALNHSDSSHFQEIMGLTGGKGVDIVLEMLANVNLGLDLPILAQGGRVVVIGSRGPVEINARDLMQRDASITGVMLPRANDEDVNEYMRALEAGLSTGTIRPVVAATYPLAELGEAQRRVMSGQGASGNLVVLVD